MNIIRHGLDVPCKQKHIHTTRKIKDITCPACKKILQEHPGIIASLGLEKPFVPYTTKEMLIASLEKPTVICSKCGSPMKERKGKHGRFLGCTSYPHCTHTKPL